MQCVSLDTPAARRLFAHALIPPARPCSGQGALLFGLDAGVIKSRVAARSYGVTISRPYTEEHAKVSQIAP